MSFQFRDSCFSTDVASANAAAAFNNGQIVLHAGSQHVINVSAVSGTSITYNLTPVSGGAPVIIVAPYSAIQCELPSVSDGVLLGWLVASSWIAVYALMFITKALRGDSMDNSYGNS